MNRYQPPLAELGAADRQDGLVKVHVGKFKVQRFGQAQARHAEQADHSTCAVLADYLERREQFFRHPVTSYVFVTRCGNRLDSGHVHRTFYTLSRSTGLRAVGASKGPRLHDFRHRFAIQTLARWYQSGADAGREMSLLSTYLGHVCVAGTYWYLSCNPELMAQAMARLERRWGESS